MNQCKQTCPTQFTVMVNFGFTFLCAMLFVCCLEECSMSVQDKNDCMQSHTN